jgi:hypothetical protein
MVSSLAPGEQEVEDDFVNDLSWMVIPEARVVKAANSEQCIICPQKSHVSSINVDYSTYSNFFPEY